MSPSSLVFELHTKLKLAIQHNKQRRILSILKTLKNTKLTIKHLETTLIGRTVNFLKNKSTGEIKILAFQLVKRWKLITLRDCQLEYFIASTQRIRI